MGILYLSEGTWTHAVCIRKGRSPPNSVNATCSVTLVTNISRVWSCVVTHDTASKWFTECLFILFEEMKFSPNLLWLLSWIDTCLMPDHFWILVSCQQIYHWLASWVCFYQCLRSSPFICIKNVHSLDCACQISYRPFSTTTLRTDFLF